MTQPITIVGGGLAGLALGIVLRSENIPVRVIESGAYPRHRVCGEFISGRGVSILKRLGVTERWAHSSSGLAETVVFFDERARWFSSHLREPAVVIPRWNLDDSLAKQFEAAGGQLLLQTRWKEDFRSTGVVRAAGRRVSGSPGQWRWFGIKAHISGIHLESDLELHCRPNGYVGICGLPNGRANVCGLFRRKEAWPELAKQWQDVLKGGPGTLLRDKLEHGEFDGATFCAVAGFSFERSFRADPREIRVGDALGMIPPVTGNGMSIAFESAEIAAHALLKYCRGEWNWDQTAARAADAMDQAFRRRLYWAAVLQWLLFQPWAASTVKAWPRLARPLFVFFLEATR